MVEKKISGVNTVTIVMQGSTLFSVAITQIHTLLHIKFIADIFSGKGFEIKTLSLLITLISESEIKNSRDKSVI
jgi:membrane glycosyltransferase